MHYTELKITNNSIEIVGYVDSTAELMFDYDCNVCNAYIVNTMRYSNRNYSFNPIIMIEG
jgi:hypothetical protein